MKIKYKSQMKSDETVSAVVRVWGRARERVEHTSQQLSILCLLSHMSESEIHFYTEHGASWLQKHLQYYKEGSKQVS